MSDYQGNGVIGEFLCYARSMENVGCPDEDAGDDGTEDEDNAVVTSYTEIAGRCLRKSEWNDWDWDDNL